MFELISAFSFLGTYQVVAAVFTALRTKFIAILLGPNGLGIFSQAKNFQNITWFMVTVGLNEGVVKLIAEANAQEDRDRQKRIVLTVSLIYIILGSFTLILCWLFRDSLAEWIFGSRTYNDLIVFVGVSAFFLGQYRLMLNVFRGLLKWKLYAAVAIAGYATGIVISLIFIWAFGLRGAVVSMIITQLTGLSFGLILMKLPVRKEFFEKIYPNWIVIKELLKYVAPLLGRQIILLITGLYIRRAIIVHLGADQSGIYHVLVAVSDVYFWAIVQPVTAYSMPKAASLVNDTHAIVKVQNNGVRLALLGIFPCIVLIYGLREVWIPLFFSNEFLQAGSLLLWWLVGDIFRALWVILNVDLLPLNRLRYLFFQTLFYCAGLIIVTVPFISDLGLMVAAMGYLVMHITIFIVSFLYHLHSTGFKLYTENIMLLLKATGLLTFTFWFSHISELSGTRMLIIVTVLITMFFGFLKSSEREFAISFVFQKVRSILRLPHNKG